MLIDSSRQFDPNHPPFIQGVDVPREEAKIKFAFLKAAAYENLHQTHLVQPGTVREAEVQALIHFTEDAAIISPDIFNQSTREHLWLTSLYAEMIGYDLNHQGYELNIHLLQALSYFSDIGRTFSHRRHRNDLIGERLMRSAGIRRDIIDLLPAESRWMPARDDKNGIDDYASLGKMIDVKTGTDEFPYQAVIEIADVLGKYQYGKLMRWDQHIDPVNPPRLRWPDPQNCWPSEYVRQTNVMQRIGTGVLAYYQQIGFWFVNTTGITMSQLVDRMETRLALPT